MKSRIIIKEGNVFFSETKRKIAKDLIIGRANAGFGFLGDKFYPELNAVVSLRFGDRFNRANNEINFTYNNLFLMDRNTDGSYQMSYNAFANVAWGKNLMYKGAPSWLGIGAGYLISNHGNYFKGNTMKFFIGKSIAPGVSVSPELYLTDDFKKGIMGIKFNFTF